MPATGPEKAFDSINSVPCYLSETENMYSISFAEFRTSMSAKREGLSRCRYPLRNTAVWAKMEWGELNKGSPLEEALVLPVYKSSRFVGFCLFIETTIACR